MAKSPVVVCWFRRDLRLDDQAALAMALQSELQVLPLFIFDSDILEHLPEDDARVSFIYETLQKMDSALKEKGSGLLVKYGKPAEIWKELIATYTIKKVYFNKDYEPYARERDKEIIELLLANGIAS